jgi:hypothetical protein
MNGRGKKTRERPAGASCAPLPDVMRDAILVFAAAAEGNVRWAIDGSAALALQGVDVVPHDLDILTDKVGAYRIGRQLEKFAVKSVSYGKTSRYSSHFGIFSIAGVKIEVMGNLKVFRNGKWTKTQNPSSVKLRRVQVGGRTISVVSLDSLKESGYLDERLRRNRHQVNVGPARSMGDSNEREDERTGRNESAAVSDAERYPSLRDPSRRKQSEQTTAKPHVMDGAPSDRATNFHRFSSMKINSIGLEFRFSGAWVIEGNQIASPAFARTSIDSPEG